MRKFSKIFENEISTEMGSKYDDVIADIKEKTQEGSFDIDSFIAHPEEHEIEGLIDDSDVFDFYLKYRTQIDDILGDVNFYQETPEEKNVFSLYDYIIVGTKEAVVEFVKLMKDTDVQPEPEVSDDQSVDIDEEGFEGNEDF